MVWPQKGARARSGESTAADWSEGGRAHSIGIEGAQTAATLINMSRISNSLPVLLTKLQVDQMVGLSSRAHAQGAQGCNTGVLH